MQWNGGKKMKNSYYNEIVNLLMEHPDGVPVRKIARQIYNTDVNLFDPDSAGKFRGIHLSVQRFLCRRAENSVRRLSVRNGELMR